MEAGETVVGQEVVVITGDTLVDRISTVGNVTTFWLSGGTAADYFHAIRVSVTTNLGKADGFVVAVPVPA